jgi:hypothetical protein
VDRTQARVDFRTRGVEPSDSITTTAGYFRSPVSSVGIATGYGLSGRRSIPDRYKRFSSTPQNADRFWGPPSLLWNRYQGLFPPGVKRQRRETDHSPSIIAEIKNSGATPKKKLNSVVLVRKRTIPTERPQPAG